MRWRPLSAALILFVALACTDGGNPEEQSAESTPGSTETGSSVEATTTTAAPSGTFTSNGIERDGWFWLDGASATARWELSGLDPGTPASIEVTALVGSATLTPSGFAAIAFDIGSDDRVVGSTEGLLRATPVPDHPDLAMARGSLPLDAVVHTATIGPSPLVTAATDAVWVELAGSDTAEIGVRPDSVALGAASIPVAAMPEPAPSIVSTPPSTRLDGEFSTNGDEISGWWWVRDGAHTHFARWDFAVVPDISTGVTAQLHVLATDGFDGGPGFDARFYLAWGFTDVDGNPVGSDEAKYAPPPPADDSDTTLLTVPNVSPPGDPVGYTAQDVFTLTPEQVPAGSVGIWFEATRDDPSRLGSPTGEHVAFNAASVGLLVTGTDGSGTGGDDLEGDGGGVETGGGTITDPDGQADADSAAEADDVGDLDPGTYHGTLDGETEDWFAFQLDATQIVDIEVLTPAGLYVDISVLDPVRYRVAPHASQESDTSFSYSAPRGGGGRHYLQLYRLQGSGEYTFTITVRDPDDAMRHVDAGETITEPLAIGLGDVIGEVTRFDGGDVYSVTLAAGQSLSATLLTLSDENLELELYDADGTSLDFAGAYPEQAAALFLAADTGPARQVLVVVRRDDVGGWYRLRLTSSGLGECTDAELDAEQFTSSGSSSGLFVSDEPGWTWLGSNVERARAEQATWTFHSLPDDAVVRVLFDLAIDESGAVAAGAWATYGAVDGTGAVRTSAPQFVAFRAEPRGGWLTGFAATGELDIPHADLSSSDAWWVRLTLADPSRPTAATLGSVGLGVSAASVTVCAAGSVDSLDGVTGAVDPPPIDVTYDATSHTLSANTTMFVDPGSDLDGDGLNQDWEDAAMVLANPIIEVDEEELWQFWTDRLTANFVQVTPWPSATDPVYIVIGYLNTWAYDPGGGTLQATDLVVFENHRGDSERIWEAWRVIDDQTAQLEWVNTSAHASYTEHSGVWRPDEQQCNVGYVASVSVDASVIVTDEEGLVEHGWGFFEVMCDQLAFDDQGRLVMMSAQNKHAMYPSDATCNDVTLGAMVGTGVPLASEDCGWDTIDDPLGIWWDDDDFDGDSRYRGGGRWQFDVFNAGEPGYPLIDDLDANTDWLGMTSDQVIALTGEYPNEAVWSGYHPDGSNFCGGLDAGDELPLHWWSNDLEVPDKCSSVLGGKLVEWQSMFVDAMSSRYHVVLGTGTDFGAGTDEAVTIELRDAGGTLLASRLYYGDLESGATDSVYMAPRAWGGGDVATVSLRRTGFGGLDTADWQVDAVEVTDLATGQTVTAVVDQWVGAGAGITIEL